MEDAPKETRPLDPLRRVFVPIERKMASGQTVFRTTDQMVYARLDDGSIRRAIPKQRGKSARRHDKEVRRGAKIISSRC